VLSPKIHQTPLCLHINQPTFFSRLHGDTARLLSAA
jgi:hypothetical protein